jgi:hypothetical protein
MARAPLHSWALCPAHSRSPHATPLRRRSGIRHGERPLPEVPEAISDAEAQLATLRDSPAIADQPVRTRDLAP